MPFKYNNDHHQWAVTVLTLAVTFYLFAHPTLTSSLQLLGTGLAIGAATHFLPKFLPLSILSLLAYFFLGGFPALLSTLTGAAAMEIAAMLFYQLRLIVAFVIRFVFAESMYRAFFKSCGVTCSPVGYKGDNKKDKYDMVIKTTSSNLFRRWVLTGHDAWARTYVQGLWETDDIITLHMKLRDVTKGPHKFHIWQDPTIWIFAPCFEFLNLQAHFISPLIVNCYNYSNEFYEGMLDSNMQYSSAYWREAKTLAEAQVAKMKLIAEKLRLKPGMKVLDIGCGWGGLANWLSTNYGVTVEGVTLSKEQYSWAVKKWASNKNVHFHLADYRDFCNSLPDESFDAIVNVGFLEHVGICNCQPLFATIRRMLKPNAICLVQTIAHRVTRPVHAWAYIMRAVFPWSQLPSITDVSVAAENTALIIEDAQNRGHDYGTTLVHWANNVIARKDKIIKDLGVAQYRHWVFWLQITAAEFFVRRVQLWQIVLTRGVAGGYYTSI